MKEITCLVDCDGVLVDFVAQYMVVFKQLHGWCFKREEITEWEFKKCVCTAEEDDAVWAYFDVTAHLVYNIPVIDGALEGLKALRALRNTRVVCVVCVTSPHHGTYWSGERFRWLLGPGGFKKSDIVLASDKTHVKGDCLIDDAIHNLDAYDPHAMKTFLFDAPYNQHKTRHERCVGWDDVVASVESYLSEI